MKYALSLVALFTMSCSQTPDIKDTGPSGIDLTALDRSVDPCADFYTFACGGWITQHPVGPGGGIEAKFFDPYYTALPMLKQIIADDAGGARAADDPFAAFIGDYYTSCIGAPADTTSREVLKALLAKIDAVATLDDLAREMADQRDVGSGTFFQLYVGPDAGDTTRNVARLYEGGTELADRSYYLDPSNKDLLADYQVHINTMSGLLGATPIDAAAAIRVETALATAALPSDVLLDPASLYNPMTAAEAAALAPTFPWQTFWNQAGFTGLKTVNVAVPAYLTALDTLFKTAPLEDLKAYLRWQLLQDRSGGLDQAFIDEDARFWGKFTGQLVAPPRWFTCFNDTLSQLGQAVARPYVARDYDEKSTAITRDMFDKGRAAFSRRLATADWLDTPTRKAALAKLDAMVAKIGHPDKDPNLAGLTIASDSFIRNETRLRQFKSARDLARLDQPVDRTEWHLSPLTVNAIYVTSANDVTLPAGLLSSPFLQASRISAANFGALGVVLGHEMTHGFDNQGRHFDGKGTLSDWWTPAVAASFTKRSQCLIDEFDAFEALPGEHVDGALTLGENLADLGGLNVSFNALFDGNDDEPGGDGFNARQVFFLGYAQLYCENVHPDLQSQLLLTDPHAPGRFRVNGPLANLPEFAEAFACSATAPMVRAEPCEVW